VHFVEDGGSRLPGRLEHGDIHVAVFVDLRFRYRLLYPAYCLAVLSPRSPLGHRRALDIAELASEPILLLNRGFTSRDWFDSACSIERIRPRVLLESAAPHALIALARRGYGIAVVPSNVAVPPGVRALPLVQRGVPLGRWLNVSWDPRRLLAAYTRQFVDELVAHCQRDYPNRDLTRRAPPLPRPKSSAN
jgi:LysR family cyn operon transcriptional activator